MKIIIWLFITKSLLLLVLFLCQTMLCFFYNRHIEESVRDFKTSYLFNMEQNLGILFRKCIGRPKINVIT